MQVKRMVAASFGVFLLVLTSTPGLNADPFNGGDGRGNEGDDHGPTGEHGPGVPPIRHVLLLSIDGMHALDFTNCAQGLSTVQGGPYCPNLAGLATHGVTYLDTSTSKPSDSFPGLMAIVTGGSPRTVGAFYDVAYDRSLQPPAVMTGNQLAAGSCAPGQTPTGTSTEYEEGIDIDQSKLNGGAPTGDGGANSIDPRRLPRDPSNNCAPVFPHNFIRVNTIFGVVKAARGYTAWADKHPAYEAVNGPGDGHNVDDFFGPEINSVSVDMPQVTILPCNPLPDQAAEMAGDDYTGSFQNIQCYDSLKVQAILNQINGRTHNGSARAPVPTLFGMNFQAVSVGQKLVYQHGAVAVGFSGTGGYTDAIGTPSATLLQEIRFVDNAIGMMVSALKAHGLYDSTLIVISAKHGQSPIDPGRLLRIPGDLTAGQSPATILDALMLLPASEAPSGNQIGPTEDDVSLLWLSDSSQTANAVSALESASPPMNNIAGIGEIFSGPAIGTMFNLPGLPPNGDSRTPDIVITPNVGVIYTGKQKKVMEHGGFARDDTNVIMLLANPGLASATVTSPVETAQIAPTILKALGLDPHSLEAVRMEHTQALPGFRLQVD
jgi:Type I phosphodiesterase / nucleotide pyrophosphatase